MGTEKKRSVRNEIFDWVIALVVALAIALFLTQVVVVNAQVPTESMEPTINTGDRLLGNRLAYLFSEPQRGDIVIFWFPDNEEELYVKRIIGMPGETLTIVGGVPYINGNPMPELNEHINGASSGSFGPYVIPEGCYFMMGDNRSRSSDSRYWNNTFVTREAIVGKAWIRLFPSPTVLE